VNAAHARYLDARRQLVVRPPGPGEQRSPASIRRICRPRLPQFHELIVAALRCGGVRAKAARAALTRAERAARRAGIAA